jgi:hypothetical protein
LDGEITMTETDVPWDRIVHFFGRATDVPTWIEDLATPRHKEAESLLLRNLEHQDGVIQATPVAVALMVESLREGRVQDRDAVRKILTGILEAARFQIEVHGRPLVTPPLASVIAPTTWWPEFESDEVDEALWEEWSPSEEEFVGWAVLTEQLIVTEGIVPVVEESTSESAQIIKKPWWRFW